MCDLLEISERNLTNRARPPGRAYRTVRSIAHTLIRESLEVHPGRCTARPDLKAPSSEISLPER